MNFFQAEYTLDGDTIVVGFGPDASKIDAADRAAVQAQLARLVPGVEVLEVATHDWVADPLAGETWPMHRTGFLANHLAAFHRLVELRTITLRRVCEWARKHDVAPYLIIDRQLVPPG